MDLEKYTAVFSDVSENAWYSQYVETALKAGLVSGVGNGRFNPGATITREEMAVMVMRAYQYQTKKTIADEAKGSTAQFDDMGIISSWAKDAVLAAQANGIINGMTEKTFQPKGNARRDQVAKMLIKLLETTGQI